MDENGKDFQTKIKRHPIFGRLMIDDMLKIAVIPGDGIGKEVIPEGLRVLEEVGKKFNISFNWDERDWSCEYYSKTGKMMPDDGLDQIIV